MKLGKAVVKGRVLILVVALLLLIPSVFGMIFTRVNYDMLNYLPDSLDTVKGQKYMLEDFGKGAFSFLIFEDMDDRQISAVTGEIKEVDHVADVLAYSDVTGGSVPAELLPDDVYHAFNADSDTLVAVFFDTSGSADETMDAIGKIRAIAGKNCLVSGISAMVTDLRDLCEREEAVYVAIAVVLAVAAMLLFLDNWLIPFVFLAGIGISILLNLGSKALSAVLQLAVTMDYSIFLWHSYGEHKQHCADHEEAMALAIKETFASVIGSSVTTVAGFIALCFMTFTLGRDLGIVMAKGVLLGVLGCVTVLPAMILVLDKPLAKTMHRSLIPPAKKLASGIVKIFPVFLILFAALAAPAYYGYSRTNDEVYYDLSRSLPEDMPNVIANSKLEKEFAMGSTHMVLVNAKLPSGDVRRMQEEFKQTDGIKFCIGLESLVGSSVPEEMIPESVSGILKSDRWELMLLSSEYRTATGEMGSQVKALNQIIKKYDPDGLLVGEAACTNDLINITSVDFATVNTISIVAIFIIIALVEKSISLPIILVAVIELAIFINLGLPHYLGESLPFIAPICISTIQLGATVDYAILMTTRYKQERARGNDKKEAVKTALAASLPSVIVSAMGLFAATVGVAVYSEVDMISSLCALMARGALISLFCVAVFLPAMFMLFDKLIGMTTIGFKKEKTKTEG